MEPQESSSALGDVIRERRLELEMSQEAVALAADTNQAWISRIESGESWRVVPFQRIAPGLVSTPTEVMRRVEQHEGRH